MGWEVCYIIVIITMIVLALLISPSKKAIFCSVSIPGKLPVGEIIQFFAEERNQIDVNLLVLPSVSYDLSIPT